MRSLTLILGIIFLSATYADMSEEDLLAFNSFLEEKHLVSVKKEKGDLSIGGEVRVEYQNNNHKVAGAQPAGAPPIHDYDVEINLLLDYKSDRMWGNIKLEFDNTMGAESGIDNKLRLEKAYFGSRLIQHPSHTLDAEIGRRSLGDVFTSKVLFGSRFDGLLLTFNKNFLVGDFYAKGAAFLITTDGIRFGQVIETGLKDIGNSGLAVQYSLSNWRKNPFAAEVDNRYEFLISQVTLSKAFNLPFTDKKVTPYIAGIVNGAAKEKAQTAKQFAPFGYYLGVSMGQIKKMGDWRFDVNYQWMQAQSVPDFDSCGIGKGKTKTGLYTYKDNNGQDVKHTRHSAVGKANFRGVRTEFLYALYDNLTLFNSFQVGKTLDNKIGPKMNYNQFEMEMIYSF